MINFFHHKATLDSSWYLHHQSKSKGFHFLDYIPTFFRNTLPIIIDIMTKKKDDENKNHDQVELGNLHPLHPTTVGPSKLDGLQGALQHGRLHRHPRHLHLRRLHHILPCQVILSFLALIIHISCQKFESPFPHQSSYMFNISAIILIFRFSPNQWEEPANCIKDPEE